MNLHCSLALAAGPARRGEAGGIEAGAPAPAEPPLEYRPRRTGVLTPSLEAGRGTVPGGQFDWGGRLLKGNGGARRSARDGRQPSFRVQERKRA